MRETLARKAQSSGRRGQDVRVEVSQGFPTHAALSSLRSGSQAVGQCARAAMYNAHEHRPEAALREFRSIPEGILMAKQQDGYMSSEEAIAMLKAGKVKEWNLHREAHPNWRADLSNADLTDASLSGADLTGADLSGAVLRGANLIRANLATAYLGSAHLNGADLSDAHLSVAYLGHADFSQANLSDAHLSQANLSSAVLLGANLSGAVFLGANLSGAVLLGANLSGAIIGVTSFGANDLSEAIGLETVQHEAPSFVDTHTLLKFRGKIIPKSFLLGCGMPEAWIDYLPVLLESMEPIQLHSCFLSHSSEDQAFAEKLHKAMTDAKIRVWYAPEDMRGGRKSRAQIDQAIRLHDKLLIVLSPHSISSGWVKTEIREARQKEIETRKRVLFPIALMSIDDIREWKFFDADRGEDLAIEVREYHIPDFREWENDEAFAREFDRLIEDLKADEQLQPEKSK